MKRLKNILVAVDFSASSACALLEAARLSTWTGAALHAIHAIDAALVAEFERRLHPLPAEVREAFIEDARKRWGAFIGDHPVRDMQPEIVVGNRLEAILRRVRDSSVDLLVMGTHGETGPDVGTGPLALACAREAPTRVLLVRPPHSGRFQCVVACIDFSESSCRALEEASDLASRDGAKLVVLHVFHSPWNDLSYVPPALEPFAEFAGRYRRSIEQRLADFCDKHGAGKAERRVLDHASPGIAAASFAREARADLVVMGSRGAADARVTSIGSATERLLQETPCSVLSVR